MRTKLLDQKLRIYHNHKNLTCKKINSDRVLRWRLILEEYAPDIAYIKGENNIIADGMSKIPLNGEKGNHTKVHLSTGNRVMWIILNGADS